MHKKEKQLFYIVFFIIGIFPVLPFRLKPIGIILSMLLGIYFLIKNKKIYIHKMYVNNAILFFAYLFSYFVSTDKTYAIKYIETSLSFLLFPLFFSMISTIKFNKDTLKRIEILFYSVFYFATLCYSVFIFIYIFYLGYFNDKVTYDYTLSYIRNMFWGFSEDLILISISLVLSLLFSIKLVINLSKYKYIFIIGNLFLLLTLFYISRKGVIIAGIISFGYLVFKALKNIQIKLVALSFILISGIVFYLIFPNSYKRIDQLFQTETYTKPVDLKNSTSIRLQVYKCAIENIKKTGLFGVGIGDVNHKLYECYLKKANAIANQKLNAHNVYFNILIGQGYFGFILFLIVLYNLFRYAIKNHDIFFTSILILYAIEFLTENILDKQNGVLLFTFLINFNIFINEMNKKTDEKE